MRKVVSGLFISLDGVVEGPDQWQFDVFDADMARTLSKHLGEVDAILLGRVTYQEWVEYWPNHSGAGEDAAFADHINNSPKYVVSDTLSSTEWQNSTLVRRADLAATIKELKQQPGKNIAVTGSPTLAQWLLHNDLLDELTLMIHPVVAGGGKRLLTEGDLKRLTLADSKITGSGVAILTYRPR